MSDPKVEVVDSAPTVLAAPFTEAVNENGSVPETTEGIDAGKEDKVTDSAETKAEKVVKLEVDESKTKTNGHSKSEYNNRRAKGKFDNNRGQRARGSKFDPSVLPKSNDAAEIRNQVEFYFGDSNLPTDTFLWDLTDGSSNKPVPVETIKNFGRMKRFESYPAIVEALKKSEILEVSGPDGAEMVNRKIPYNPDQPKHPSLLRSVYVKGFGEELPSSQFDIEAFFTPYGPTNAVRLRRNDFKEFKGSVFVEFADEETAQKFLNLDPKPLWQGEELQIMSKKEYEELRVQEIKDGKREPNATRGPKARGRGSGNRFNRGDGNRGDRDPDDWKKRREDDQKSGFRDDRKDRNSRHGGRGGRGRGDRDRRPRDNNRNQERQEESESKAESKDEENIKKRAREDDTGGDEAPAKKLDVKDAIPASAS